MATPTRLQAHLLRGVQNLALENERRRSQDTDAGADVGELTPLRIGERSLALLEEVAIGVGVPHAWIAYARAAGERGTRWQPGQQLLGSGRVEREHLLVELGHRIRELQDMAAVGAAVARHAGLDGDSIAGFRRVMGMTWQRVGATAHALALSREEQYQLWRRGQQHWATVVADNTRGVATRDIAERWNRVVVADFSVLAVPVMVLQGAGITAEDVAAAMPISPDDMVAHVADALTTAEDRGLVLVDPVHGPQVDAISVAVTETGLQALGAADAPDLPADADPASETDLEAGP